MGNKNSKIARAASLVWRNATAVPIHVSGSQSPDTYLYISKP